MTTQPVPPPGDSRASDIFFGLVTLTVAGFFGYFGVHGAWAYLHGSREAPADPVACAIGIAVFLWLGHVAFRLLAGWHLERPLLPGVFLLLGSLAAIAGAVWFLTIDRSIGAPLPQQVEQFVVFAGAGLAGLRLWWQRRRGPQ